MDHLFHLRRHERSRQHKRLLRYTGRRRTIYQKMAHIKRPTSGTVFLDEGRLTSATFTIYNDQPKWWDQIPVRHNNGLTLSFADSHCEFWKWQDQRTIDYGSLDWEWVWNNGYRPTHIDNPDLENMQKACWGKLAYQP